MLETYSTVAVILNRHPFRESDTRVVLYCGDKGKLELVAKGTKKISSKLSGHLEPITMSRVMVVKGRNIDYLAAASSLDSFAGIKNDLDKSLAACFAANAFGKLIKTEHRDEKLFSHLSDFLEYIDRTSLTKEQLRVVAYFFLMHTLSLLGYQPQLYKCVICGLKLDDKDNHFDLEKGGIVCYDCRNNLSKNLNKVSVNVIKLLRLAINEQYLTVAKVKASKESANMAIKIIFDYYRYCS